jgi:hypothetical protein
MSNKLGKRKRKERENSARNEDILKPFQKGWYKQQSKNDRDMFESISVVLLAMLLFLCWVLIDYNNPEIHKVLGYGCLMVGLAVVFRRGDLKSIFYNTKKVYSNYQESNLAEIGDTVFLVAVILSMLTILFIIDLDILSNAGIRIGAAGGVALVSVLGHVIKSFWRR